MTLVIPSSLDVFPVQKVKKYSLTTKYLEFEFLLFRCLIRMCLLNFF